MTKEQTNSWGKEVSNILIEMWVDLIHRKNSASVEDVKNYSEQYEEKRDKLFNLISKTISQEREKMIDKETPKIQALVFAAIASGEFQKDYGQLAIDTTEKIINLLQNK